MSDAQKIAYYGLEGSYSYQAAIEYFPGQIYNGYRTLYSVIEAVQTGEVDLAVAPVENTAAGRVMEVHNMLPETGLNIVGEYLLPIHHCLMVPKKAFRSVAPVNIDKDKILEWKNSPLTEEEIKKAFSSIIEVRSHAQALTQCRKFIQEKLPKAVAQASYDTAGAARDIAQNDNAKIAAIASKSAAKTYQMAILQENIEDIHTNTTRFLVFSKQALPKEEVGKSALTTILFELDHKPGALLRALTVFDKYQINLTKLETYMCGPTKPNPSFYVDFAASIYDESMEKALEEFQAHILGMTILGCYNADPKRGPENGFLSV